MEFLVEIDVRIPPAEADAVVARERARGRELVAAGTIERIWRVPGITGNVGVWSAPDATALHQAIASLPAFPYANVRVTPLADHPLEKEPACA